MPSEPERPAFHPGITVKHDETEQAYVMLGMPGLSLRDERRYTLSVLDTILGGGMSSRLFQEVREERGLVYEISTFQQAYRGAGMFRRQRGDVARARVQQCVDVILEQIDRLARRRGHR